MCNIISKESMQRGISRVASGRSNVNMNGNTATGKCFTAFGVKTITISRDQVTKAGREVMKRR